MNVVGRQSILVTHELIITPRGNKQTGFKITKGDEVLTRLEVLIIQPEDKLDKSLDFFIQVISPDESDSKELYPIACNMTDNKSTINRLGMLAENIVESVRRLMSLEEGFITISNGFPSIDMLETVEIKVSLLAKDLSVKKHVEGKFKFHPDEIEETRGKLYNLLTRNIVYK